MMNQKISASPEAKKPNDDQASGEQKMHSRFRPENVADLIVQHKRLRAEWDPLNRKLGVLAARLRDYLMNFSARSGRDFRNGDLRDLVPKVLEHPLLPDLQKEKIANDWKEFQDILTPAGELLTQWRKIEEEISRSHYPRLWNDFGVRVTTIHNRLVEQLAEQLRPACRDLAAARQLAEKSDLARDLVHLLKQARASSDDVKRAANILRLNEKLDRFEKQNFQVALWDC